MTDQAWPLCRDMVTALEGGFQKDPQDPGNWTGGEIGKGILKGTKFGISAAVYPDIEIESLTLDQATAIYKRDYYDVMNCGNMPLRFALAAFDGSILQGPEQTAFCLQRALKTPEDGKIDAQGSAMKAMWEADKDPKDQAMIRFLAQRATAEDKIFVRRPAMIVWAGNWEERMFTIARAVFGPELRLIPGGTPPWIA